MNKNSSFTVNAGWWDSVKNFLTRFQTPKPKRQPTQVTPTGPTGPFTGEEKAAVITEAARRYVMLYMKYNGVRRMVEPYSYRHKSTGMLFMGYCHIHQSIEAFKPEKIEEIQLTQFPFAPRWPVEIGRE